MEQYLTMLHGVGLLSLVMILGKENVDKCFSLMVQYATYNVPRPAYSSNVCT